MAIKPRKPTNYLNNKDLLKEIHKSKTSYCSFTDPDYHQYDIIIDIPESDLDICLKYALHPDQIKRAKETRAARLSIDAEEKISSDSIADTDLIYRVMTWDHIPVAQKEQKKSSQKKTAKDIFVFEEDDNDLFVDLDDSDVQPDVDDMVHVKVNFPPFQHFKLDDTRTFRCVGKSHWIGGVENGEFSKDHGNITNKLAKMYMMLCAKYAMKYNWRGYTYRDEMEASAILQLTYAGLRFNESKSANPFAYFTQTITNGFRRVLNLEKKAQKIRDDILERNGLAASHTRQSKNMDTN